MRVTREALATKRPIWIFRDNTDDLLDWCNHLLTSVVVPVAPYNPRNTDDSVEILFFR
jgi:hypothetical protein